MKKMRVRNEEMHVKGLVIKLVLTPTQELASKCLKIYPTGRCLA